MSTTPNDPTTPTDGGSAARDDTQPIAEEAPRPTVEAGDTQPIAGPGDTQPITGPGDTQPIVPAAASAPAPAAAAPVAPPTPPVAAPAPAAPAPAAPAAGAPAVPPQHYGAQHPAPYAGPAYPAQPQAGPPQPGQPYPQQYAGQPYAAQQPYPYGPRAVAPGQAYGYPGQPYPAAPYQQAPHAGPAAGGPGGPAGPSGGAPVATLPGAPAPAPRRRGWIPVVVTLVIVAMLAVAAVFASTRLNGRDEAAAQEPSSMATIGQSNTGTIPVAGSTSDNPDWAAVASAVQGSVVSIAVQTSGGEALGSGVVVDSSGHVVTNNHVVEGLAGDTVQVTLSDGRMYEAKVAGTDPSTDLAVVTITNPPSDLEVAQFGDSDQVKVGDPVMAVGNPLGLANTVTTGIVSAVDRPVSPRQSGQTTGPVTNAIQIDAAVNPGNSGGPLFDAHGRVIGITSSIATTSSDSGSIGIGFAIPVNLVQNIAGQLVQSGTAQHAYIGVKLSDGTATADGVTRRGAQVAEVTDGSPAAKAGIQVGDVVVAIDGKPVGGSDSLAAYARAMAAGDKATLLVVRNGSTVSVDVTLAAQPDTAQTTPDQGGSQQGDQGSQGLPGNMTPDELWQWLQQHGFGQDGSGSGSSN